MSRNCEQRCEDAWRCVETEQILKGCVRALFCSLIAANLSSTPLSDQIFLFDAEAPMGIERGHLHCQSAGVLLAKVKVCE